MFQQLVPRSHDVGPVHAQLRGNPLKVQPDISSQLVSSHGPIDSVRIDAHVRNRAAITGRGPGGSRVREHGHLDGTAASFVVPARGLLDLVADADQARLELPAVQNHEPSAVVRAEPGKGDVEPIDTVVWQGPRFDDLGKEA